MIKPNKTARSAFTVGSLWMRSITLLTVIFATLFSTICFAVSYQVSIIETGEGGQQTALPAFLSNTEVADLVLITIDKKGQRTLSVLPQQAGLYATHGPGRALDADLVVNSDGMDDLVIPGFNGFLIHIQRADGSFSAPVNLRAPPIVELSFNDYPWYQPRQKYVGDMTLDGRNDVSVLIKNQLHVFPQLENGQFLPTPIMVDTGIDLDFGGMEELSAAMRDMDQSDSLSRALIKLRDIDGDGVVDMLVISVKSQGVFRKQTSYQLHRGINVKGKLALPNSR